MAPRRGLMRLVPAWLLPFALIARWDRPIGVWLMLLPALWGLAYGARPGHPSVVLFILFFIGAWAMRGAGCTINDMLDRKLDAQVARTALRPLASGSVSLHAATLWLVIQLLVGLCILLTLPLPAICFGVAAGPLIALYPLMKRITWWPQAWLGMTFNWGLLIGVLAVGGHIDAPALLLYVGAILWTLGYDTIYAVQDRADDAQVGVRSTARLFGRHVRLIVHLFYVGALGLWALAGLLANLGQPYWQGMAAALVLAIWLLGAWKTDDMLSCRRAFIRNQYIGLAMLLGLLW